MPSHAYPLTGLPQRDIGADRIDAAGDLMAWHARILKSGPHAFLNQRVAVADAARFHLDANLAATRLGHGALNDFEITSGLADLHGFHTGSFPRG
jgi:hypothetical protein